MHTHPPSRAGQGKKPSRLYLDLKTRLRFGRRLALQTPELRDRNCCEWLGGDTHTPPVSLCCPRPFSHAGGAMGQRSWDGARMLQPPAAPGHWVQPLGGGVSRAPPRPVHAKPAARLSAGFIISQDLWRKTKFRAVLVINQEFFARFPSCFLGLYSSGPPTPQPPPHGQQFFPCRRGGWGEEGPQAFELTTPPIDEQIPQDSSE